MNSVSQTTATTFAFSSVFILLLWYMDSTVYLPWFALLSVSVYNVHVYCVICIVNVTSFLPTFPSTIPLSYILILRNADLIYFLRQIQIVFTSDDDLNYFYVRCRYKVFLLVMRI